VRIHSCFAYVSSSARLLASRSHAEGTQVSQPLLPKQIFNNRKIFILISYALLYPVRLSVTFGLFRSGSASMISDGGFCFVDV